MAKPTETRCSCCGFKADELANGVCLDCGQGRHQRHCTNKAIETVTVPKQVDSAPAQAEPATAPEAKTEEPPAQPFAEPPPTASPIDVPKPAAALVPASQAATPTRAPRSIEATARGLVLASLDDMYRFSKIVVASGLAPKGMETPEAVLVAIQFGAEVGLTPMQALQNVANIGGRPALFGDAPKGVVEASRLMEDFDEWFEDQNGVRIAGWPAKPEPECAAMCMSKRIGRPAMVTRFTWGDALRAQLTGKKGPWQEYPGRQMKFRARGFNLRDNFPDVIKGFRDDTEVSDIIDITPARQAVEMPRRASEAATETPAS